jgi:hypothetical protein
VSAPAAPRSPMSGKAIVDSQFERAADLINLEDYMRRIALQRVAEAERLRGN